MTSHRSTAGITTPAHPGRRNGCFAAIFIPSLTIIALALIAVIATNNPGQKKLTPNTSFGAASPVPGAIAPFFTPAVQYWSGSIQAWAGKWQLSANLIATVMQIESCGDPHAISAAGARGLFQVMPLHFKTNEDPLASNTNALRGLGYLKHCQDAVGGDVRQSLACYNGGESIVGLDESAWPDETNRYVYWGTGIYQEASQGATHSVFLQEWLLHGGSRLCHQANQRLNVPP